MGTRGAVAIGTITDWSGTYNHFDSYPTGLGKDVWDTIKKDGLKNVVNGVKSSGDWREYLSGGVCEYCGKKTGQPHSINGRIMKFAPLDPDIQDNINKTGYPDPLADYHDHNEKSTPAHMSEYDPLFIGWVYILDPENNKIHVLTHCVNPDADPKKFENERYTIPAYKWEFVCSIDLNGPEPNWEKIDKMGGNISDKMQKKMDNKNKSKVK